MLPDDGPGGDGEGEGEGGEEIGIGTPAGVCALVCVCDGASDISLHFVEKPVVYILPRQPMREYGLKYKVWVKRELTVCGIRE